MRQSKCIRRVVVSFFEVPQVFAGHRLQLVPWLREIQPHVVLETIAVGRRNQESGVEEIPLREAGELRGFEKRLQALANIGKAGGRAPRSARASETPRRIDD